MFGANNFQFETPNVIDPGDLPPPSRSSSSGGSGGRARTPERTHSSSSSYHDEPEAKGEPRLLNDIADLELSPVKPALPRSERLPFRDFPKQSSQQSRAYSPYAGNDDDDEEEQAAHSLPSSAEEARFHAASLLRQTREPTSPLNHGSVFGGSSRAGIGGSRSLRLSAPRFAEDDKRRHYIRQQVLFYGKRYVLPAAVLLAVLVGAIVGVKKLSSSSSSSSGAAPSNDHFKTVNSDPGRLALVMDFLAGTGISRAQDLDKSNSPQHQAAVWIASQDALQYELPVGPNDYESTRFIQRYVLAVFYFSTQGHQWANNPGFLSSTDECGWNEIVTVTDYLNPEIAMGVSCSKELAVTSLFLPANNLRGEMPTELQYLPELQLLGLHFNEITGSIPELYSQGGAQQPELLYVNFYRNNFTGTIPDVWGDLPHLQVLALGDNMLTGSVPASVGTLNRLKTLALDHNELTGRLEFASHLDSLQYFYAEDNLFDDTLHRNFFVGLTELVELDLSHNQLKGQVPLDLLLTEHNLDVIDLAHNEFTGQFPAAFDRGNFQTHYLNLRGNQFSGSLPNNLDSLVSLQHLDLHDNQFTGTLPNALGRCGDLIYLYLGGTNQFRGGSRVPPLSQLSELRELSLEDQGVTGPVPYWIQYLDSLELLDLSHNELTGVIPDEVWTMTNLEFLLLHDNQLEGPLPSEYNEKLKLFSLHHNDLLQDSNFDQAVCGSTGTNDEDDPVYASVDCGAGCSNDCCQPCCEADDVDCNSDVLEYYTDGLDYDAQPFAMDPDILDEAGIIETYPMDEEDPNYGGGGEIP